MRRRYDTARDPGLFRSFEDGHWINSATGFRCWNPIRILRQKAFARRWF